MQVCAQCNGVGSAVGTTANDDISDNEVRFHTALGMQPPAIPCTQCNGKGFQTFGNGA
jgi:hypothetical protein